MTWRHPGVGGDSSAVQSQLKNVQQIQATFGVFAAICREGQQEEEEEEEDQEEEAEEEQEEEEPAAIV